MNNREKKIAAMMLVPFFTLIVMFQILPFLNVVMGSLLNSSKEFTLDNYTYIFQSKFLKQAFKNSLELSIYSTIFGLIIAFQGAYSLNRLKNSSRKIVILLINMISNFNGIPLAFSFIILLGLNGVLTLILKKIGILYGFNLFSKEGLLIIYTYFQISLGILLLYPSFSKLNNDWEEMAGILGANKFTYWKRVAIPILIPEITGTALILFANAMGAYACTLALTSGNYNILTIRITSYIAGETSYEPGIASALAVILAILLIFTTIINEIFIKRGKRYES
ncbi:MULTISPECIES: ABC transporter permease subunit [Fusobacterium]|jgi:putative spermidine/putrescine transport system permease protein|uniref:ABC transporter permease subunit n=1 Tax=Fusobacterium hominis TaxID=2764326 RepID=A0A7G9GVZ2_9FUSO|nr:MULTISPECIES: ABC transporter permease subunit [Fusobacterium]QNM14974.1 ABC transporter permease subunit [Fusobacterium hominis]